MNPDLKKAYEEEADTKRLIDTSLRLEGLPRHSSTHAAGVVISSENLKRSDRDSCIQFIRNLKDVSDSSYFIDENSKMQMGNEIVVMVANTLPKQAARLISKWNSLTLIQANELESILELLNQN